METRRIIEILILVLGILLIGCLTFICAGPHLKKIKTWKLCTFFSIVLILIIILIILFLLSLKSPNIYNVLYWALFVIILSALIFSHVLDAFYYKFKVQSVTKLPFIAFLSIGVIIVSMVSLKIIFTYLTH
jgi:hypothetical protein